MDICQLGCPDLKSVPKVIKITITFHITSARATQLALISKRERRDANAANGVAIVTPRCVASSELTPILGKIRCLKFFRRLAGRHSVNMETRLISQRRHHVKNKNFKKC